MSDAPPPFPDAPDPGLAAVTRALAVGEAPPAALLGFRRDHALFRLTEEAGLLLAVRSPVLATEEARQRLADGIRNLSGPVVHVLAVGSGAETAIRQNLRDLREQVDKPDVQLAVLAPDGQAERLTRSALPGVLLERLQGLVPSHASADALRAALDEARDGGERLVVQHNAFVRRMQGRRPLVTVGLACLLALVGLTEFALGAFDENGVYVMAAMGGIIPGDAWTRPWTLLAYALLHGGPIHLAMNVYVLWILGGQLERIVGGGRVLAIFTAGALGGGVAAAMLGDGVTIGASGGIWGLLVAQGWLGFFPGDLLPRSVTGVVRKNARNNLLLNILISFAPGISMAGHLGGGLGGLVASATGVLSGGVRVDEPRTAHIAHPIQLGLLVGCAAALLLALAIGCLEGQPLVVSELLQSGQLPR
ncbi:MAG: rhomboid family intramembrane serine protease [Myxococcota bacterium]|nr:rhomboid family intramembrane serine protease [Myxococcota bacterium]